eukprot:6173714-Pleurochrysis_carterae.AAC.2
MIKLNRSGVHTKNWREVGTVCSRIAIKKAGNYAFKMNIISMHFKYNLQESVGGEAVPRHQCSFSPPLLLSTAFLQPVEPSSTYKILDRTGCRTFLTSSTRRKVACKYICEWTHAAAHARMAMMPTARKPKSGEATMPPNMSESEKNQTEHE